MGFIKFFFKTKNSDQDASKSKQEKKYLSKKEMKVVINKSIEEIGPVLSKLANE